MLLGPIALFCLMQLIKDSMSAGVAGGKKDSFISTGQDNAKTAF